MNVHRHFLMRGVLAAALGMLLLIATGGCGSSYATPTGQPADLKQLGMARVEQTNVALNEVIEKKPLASFPCGVAAVRIQAPGFHTDTDQTYGEGSYCVVTTHDVEKAADFKKLEQLPKLTGIAPINRILLPPKFISDLELRQAAAALHADILLIYTFDTNTATEDHLLPLSVVTLGLAPNVTADVTTTASAVLLDTRNGYLYGYAEATEHGQQLTNSWMIDPASTDARRRTESAAFSKLADSLKVTWREVVRKNAGASVAADAPAPATQPVAQ